MMAGPGTALDQLILNSAPLDRSDDWARASPPAIAPSPFWPCFSRRLPAARRMTTVLPPRVPRSARSGGSDRPAIGRSQAGFPRAIRLPVVPLLPSLRSRAQLARDPLPVSAMNGSLDRQVPPVENLAAIKAALRDNKDVTIVELPNLNASCSRPRRPGRSANIPRSRKTLPRLRSTAWRPGSMRALG